MKISLCMITKNEEKLLPACLDSVKDYVDEIIIVDTGSTDNTSNIALEYNAKVYHLKWENNFSTARNFALKKAKGDWILVLDADEVLENGQLINKLLTKADPKIEGFLFQILNYSNEKLSQIEKSFSVRLFRNKPEMRFFGALHEQLPIKDKFIAMTDLTINHYGYLPSVSLAKEKSKRNLEILTNELNKNPDDAFLYYNLGGEYARLHQFEQAILYYKKALELIVEETGYEARLYKMIGLSYFATKKYDEGIFIINQGIGKFPDYPDLYYIRGLCLEAVGEYLKALADFLQCLAMHGKHLENNRIYAVEEGVTSYKSLHFLRQIYEKINKKQGVLIKANIENYQLVTLAFLYLDKEKLIEGIKKYPECSLLQNEYNWLEKVIKNVQELATT